MKITKKYKLLGKHLLSALLIVLFVSPILFSQFKPMPVMADEDLLINQEGMDEIRSVFGPNAERDPRFVIVRIITIALGFVGVIFFALTIFAGFKYMTAGGNQDQTRESLKTIRNSVIGLLIVFSAWIITRFVIVMLNRGIKGQSTNFYPVFGY